MRRVVFWHACSGGVSALAMVAAATVSVPAAAQRVGVNSAVNPQAEGTPPGAATRELVIGQEVVRNERIVTGPTGQTQILLLDESAITVGPNSTLTLDEFVYDPHADTGKQAFNATRGVFRYVGGKVSKVEGAVTVQTPVGSLGIRGGAFLLRLIGDRLELFVGPIVALVAAWLLVGAGLSGAAVGGLLFLAVVLIGAFSVGRAIRR